MSHKHYQQLQPNQANYVPLSPLSFMGRTAAIFPDHLAVIYGKRRYTWSEVHVRTKKLATALKNKGIQLGDTVSALLTNTPEMVEAHFGVPMCGAVLNTINYRLEPATISYILKHADSKLLIVDSQFIESASKIIQDEGLNIPIIRVDDLQENVTSTLGDFEYEAMLAETPITEEILADAHLPADEWQALTLNYTSGTSGKPKGVVYHHRGSYLMSMGTIAAWELPLHAVYLATVPLFHCNGWGHSWTMCLMAGTIVCCRAISAKRVFDDIAEHRITHMGGAPIILGLLANAPPSEQRTIDHVVNVFTAGAPPPPAIFIAMEKLNFKVTQVYGLTETYGHVTQCLWQSKWDQRDDQERAEIKSWQGVTFPMNEAVQLQSLDSGELIPQDSDTEGEILIRGNAVMKGYYKAPEQTESAFADGWFHTGDVATWQENGYVQIRDRLKDVIISGGENISSVEIEATLYNHPAVSVAAVVAQADEKWGEVPCAFIELKEAAHADAAELDAFCRQHLAGFKVPKNYVFCALPKTVTGKIQKFKLRNTLSDN